jgi:UDP-3-O-[3-hydroxymyristoyl] glucosamine N-acyltransferase
MPSLTVSELANAIGGVVVGDGARRVEACNTLKDATENQVSLLHNAKYAKELESTRAGCVIVAPGTVHHVKRAAGLPPLTGIEAKNTYYAWQQAMVRLHGHREHQPVGISPQAAIHPTAKLGKNVHVHPFAVIGENVVVGDNTFIYPHVTLMYDVRVGSDTVLYPGVRM